MRKMFIICIALVITVLFYSCDAGLEIVDMEIKEYPERIVYFIGVDSELDLTGGVVNLLLKEKTESPNPMTNRYITVSHNIDFNKPGIYIVTLTRHVASCEFPVQVIDLNEINDLKGE